MAKSSVYIADLCLQLVAKLSRSCRIPVRYLLYDEFRNKLQLNENNTSNSYLQDFVEVFYSAGDPMKIHYKQSSSFYNIEQPT